MHDMQSVSQNPLHTHTHTHTRAHTHKIHTYTSRPRLCSSLLFPFRGFGLLLGVRGLRVCRDGLTTYRNDAVCCRCRNCRIILLLLQILFIFAGLFSRRCGRRHLRLYHWFNSSRDLNYTPSPRIISPWSRDTTRLLGRRITDDRLHTRSSCHGDRRRRFHKWMESVVPDRRCRWGGSCLVAFNGGGRHKWIDSLFGRGGRECRVDGNGWDFTV